MSRTLKTAAILCLVGLATVGTSTTLGVNRAQAVASPWPWTTSLAPEANTYSDVVYGNGLWVAVSSTGTNRAMVTTDPTCTPTAPATSCWTAVDVGTEVRWYSVTYGEGIFVAVGVGGGRPRSSR